MKPEIQEIIGKTIKGVVVAKGLRGPQSQLFLIFRDNTFYEIYSDDNISGASQAKKGDIRVVLKSIPPENEVVQRFLRK